MSSFDPAVVHAAYIIQVVRICQLVPAVVTLYDHLITLHQEVDLVWKKKWSIAKALFFWNRYFGDIMGLAQAIVFLGPPPSDKLYVPATSPPFVNRLLILACREGRIWFRVQSSMTALLILSMQSVMIFRIFAMYRNYRNILYLLLVCFGIEMVAMFVTLLVSFGDFTGTRGDISGVHWCEPIFAKDYLYAFWVSIIAFNLVLLSLVVWIDVHHRRRIQGEDQPKSAIWDILLYDSLFYFVITSMAYITTVVIWKVLPPSWFAFPIGMSLSATSVMGNRLCLNIRAAYFAPQTQADQDHDHCQSSGDIDVIARLRILPRPSIDNDRRGIPKKISMHRVQQSILSTFSTGPSQSEESTPEEWTDLGMTGTPIQWRWDEHDGRIHETASTKSE